MKHASWAITKRRAARVTSGLVLCFCLPFAHANTNVVLKNGAVGYGTPVRRQAGSLVLLVESRAPDGQMTKVERVVALAEIDRVEAEMPAVLTKAVERLAAGQAIAVLPELAAAVKESEVLGDLPGSWWVQLVTMTAHTALAVGKDAEAGRIAQVMKDSGNADLLQDARAVQSLIAAREGDRLIATGLSEPLHKQSTRPSTVAAVSVSRGLCFLKEEKWLAALKAFLEVPVFTPDEAALLGMAHFGAAQAYYGLEDYDRAVGTLEELIKAQPEIPEAIRAKELLPKWKDRRTAVGEAKAAETP